MDSQKQQASERIKQSNNILVTVSNNPSVDQLAACIGLTLSLNKMGKHATAVFSGDVPSTLEFLQPEKTIEKNTDSLRDFIIALDKSKADKLRYKVEDRVVKIFITPYRTSINEKDLEFSQGDFNVDVVVGLGVHSQAELDQAIVAHGRILHDATIISINDKPGGELGTINWLDPNASSLSELAVELVDALDKKLIDGQVATAFLTGIVAETERFSNAKTSPRTMSISAELMASGANQQLVATKLEAPAPPPPTAPIAQQTSGTRETPVKKHGDDGTLEITHDEKDTVEKEKPAEPEHPASVPLPEAPGEPPAVSTKAPDIMPLPEPETAPEPPKPAPQIRIDDHGALVPAEPAVPPSEEAAAEALLPPVKPDEPPTISHHSEGPKMILQPPTMGGQMSATAGGNGYDEDDEASTTDILGMPNSNALPDSMKDDSQRAAEAAAKPPATGGPQNVPGTSFLGDQPVTPGTDYPTEDDGINAAESLLPPESPIGATTPAPSNDETLSDIEKDVHSSHLDQLPAPGMDLPEPPAPPAALAPGLPSADGAITENDENEDEDELEPPNDMGLPPAAPPMHVITPTEPLDAGNAAPPPSAYVLAGDAAAAPSSDSPDVNGARDAVAAALSGGAPALDPVEALNANPMGAPLNAPATAVESAAGPAGMTPAEQMPETAPTPWTPPADAGQSAFPPDSGLPPKGMSLPGTSGFTLPDQPDDPNAPPPVPPPMMPPAAPAA